MHEELPNEQYGVPRKISCSQEESNFQVPTKWPVNAIYSDVYNVL